MWCGGVSEVQILKVGDLSNPSHQEGNHNVNPFRVTPTGLPRIEPVFIQGMLLYWCTEKTLVIEEISSNQGDQGHSSELRMKSVFSSQTHIMPLKSKDEPILMQILCKQYILTLYFHSPSQNYAKADRQYSKLH